jgi:hypothetical protein
MLVRHLVEQLLDYPQDMYLEFNHTIGRSPGSEAVVYKDGPHNEKAPVIVVKIL